MFQVKTGKCVAEGILLPVVQPGAYPQTLPEPIPVARGYVLVFLIFAQAKFHGFSSQGNGSGSTCFTVASFYVYHFLFRVYIHPPQSAHLPGAYAAPQHQIDGGLHAAEIFLTACLYQRVYLFGCENGNALFDDGRRFDELDGVFLAPLPLLPIVKYAVHNHFGLVV